MLKRKIKTIIIITIIVLLSSLDLISAKTLPLLGIVITIDPGHQNKIKPGIKEVVVANYNLYK